MMWSDLIRPDAFYTGATDCILCSVASSLILPILALLAVRTGRIVVDAGDPSAKLARKKKKNARKNKQSSNNLSQSGTLAEPLMETADAGDVVPTEDKENERARFQEEQERIALLQLKARQRQSIFTGALFFVSTAAQVFIGVKCIGFKFLIELEQGLLMGSGVLWINAMTWSLRELVKSHRQADGIGYVRVPELHPHSLCLDPRVHNHFCDVCGLRMSDGRAYRCKLCDFDLCVRCFSRKDQRTAEGVLRGDKGIKFASSVSTLAYFRRAVALARREWLLFLLSMTMLLLNNAAQLWAPNLQGRILDRRVRLGVERGI